MLYLQSNLLPELNFGLVHHYLINPAVAFDYSGIASVNPRKRVGTPEDIAGLAIFLCSRAGSYTVGETITCDGGLVSRSGHDLSGQQ